MNEFFATLLQFFLFYLLFKIVFAIIEAWVNVGRVSEYKKELAERLSNLIHYVEQEKHNDCYYWFDKETDQFLAQGNTDEEIKQHLNSRFKGHIFVLDENRALFGPDLKTVSLDQLSKLYNEKPNAS